MRKLIQAILLSLFIVLSFAVFSVSTGYTFFSNKNIIDKNSYFNPNVVNFDELYNVIHFGTQDDLDNDNIVKVGFNYFHHNDNEFMKIFNKLYEIDGEEFGYILIDDRVFNVVEITKGNTVETDNPKTKGFAIGTIIDADGNDIFKNQKLSPYIYLITCNNDDSDYNRYIVKLRYVIQ